MVQEACSALYMSSSIDLCHAFSNEALTTLLSLALIAQYERGFLGNKREHIASHITQLSNRFAEKIAQR